MLFRSNIRQLPERIVEASARWQLTDIQPARNLSYNFVAFATSPLASLKKEENVVLKMGLFDGSAVFDYPFGRKDVSRHDFFRPSREGQRVLAEITWQAGYDFAP